MESLLQYFFPDDLGAYFFSYVSRPKKVTGLCEYKIGGASLHAMYHENTTIRQAFDACKSYEIILYLH